MYAIPAWWGMTTKNDQERLTKYIKKSIRFGYCKDVVDIEELVKKMDIRLLRKIELDDTHPLRQYLSLRNDSGRAMRERRHNFNMPQINSMNIKDFLSRSLHDL